MSASATEAMTSSNSYWAQYATRSSTLRSERFGGGALHSADAGHGAEQIALEPLPAGLGTVVLEQEGDLPLQGRGREGREEIRRSEVAVELGNLVLEDELVAPGVPRQVGDQPVVLVEITAVVGEDQVGGELPLDRLEVVLDGGAHPGQVAVPVVADGHRRLLHAFQEGRRRGARLRRPLPRGGEDDPSDLDVGALGGKAQHGPAAADLDVVRVRAEEEDPARLLPVEDGEFAHQRRSSCTWFFFHTSQGTWPRV